MKSSSTRSAWGRGEWVIMYIAVKMHMIQTGNPCMFLFCFCFFFTLWSWPFLRWLWPKIIEVGVQVIQNMRIFDATVQWSRSGKGLIMKESLKMSAVGNCRHLPSQFWHRNYYLITDSLPRKEGGFVHLGYKNIAVRYRYIHVKQYSSY